MGAGTSWAQTDVTATYITNAGFDVESDFQTGNVATGGSNQRKAVTGWSHSGGDTYTTGAAIGFGTSGQINGANLPATNADGGTTGGALTLNAAWTSHVWYSQEITLPAGNYTMKFQVNNVGKNEGWNNDPPLFTFTTSLNTFAGNVNSYPVNTWTEQTISFSLATETTGTIKIGYKSNNTGSGNTPKFVVDYVKAFYNSNYTATLQSAIDRATRLYARTNDTDLNNAINAAQSVLAAAGTAVDYQASIDDAVTTLRSVINTAQSSLVLEGEEDITYLLENANFESSTAITGGVCTYAYDCGVNGVFYSQMQQVEGWEVVGNDNGKAAGVFAFGSNAWLANKNYTASSVTSSIGENNALALVAAWSGTVRYKQAVTLPAGVYVLTVPVFNSNGGTAISKNLIGFVTDGGTEYLATTTQYPVGSTKTETINFTLEEETSGYISLGYTAGNTGSGNCPKMFIDAITIKYFTADKSALLAEINKAQTYQDVLNNDDLAAAIATAQGVYDNTQALQAAVDAQVTALEAAISAALQNIASGTNVTSLFVTNNSFEEGNAGWVWNNASDTGVKENSNATYTTEGVDGSYLFNTWNTNTDAKYVKQSLTGLPDGYYVLKALVASDEGNSVTIYAGEGSNVISASASGKGVFVEGLAGVGVPAEGALEIGATSTNWYKADNFRLIYYATEAEAQAVVDNYDLSVANAELAAAIQAAGAAQNEVSELLTIIGSYADPSHGDVLYSEVVRCSEKTALTGALTAANGVDTSDKDAVIAATAALETATTDFLEAVPAYERAEMAVAFATYQKLGLTTMQQYQLVGSLGIKLNNPTTKASDLVDPANTAIQGLVPYFVAAATVRVGFESGEYAPYNNVEGLQALVASEAIGTNPANYTNEQISEQCLFLVNYVWTQNTEDVDAIFNGTFAETGTGSNPKGWTRSNDGWGQQITGLTAEANGVAEGTTTAWYYNNNGAWQYGNDGVYVMPLAANTAYKLTFKYAKHGNDVNNWMKVSVLNSNNEGLAVVQYPGASDNTLYQSASAYFTTGEAGNYILSLEQSGNVHLTDVSLVKATSTTKALAESTSFTPELAYYENVELTRTIKGDGTWNTFVVPFDLSNEELKAAFGEDVAVAEYSETADGDNSTVNFNTMDTPAITANTPVLLKGNAGTSYTFSGKLLKTSEAKVEGTNFDFVGTYEATTTIAEGDYFIGGNKLWKSEGNTTIAGTRAYIKAKTTKAKVACFALDGGETTAINTVNGEGTKVNGYYNLNGQRVDNPKKGLYIVNGKKVLVK